MKRKYLHAVHQCLNCGEKYERIASREGFDGCPECRSKRIRYVDKQIKER